VSTEHTRPTEWAVTLELRRQGVGPAMAQAFGLLWGFVDRKPDYICIKPSMLSEPAGTDPTTARGWLDGLEENGLIDILYRPGRGAKGLKSEWRIYVYQPRVRAAEKTERPDPQQSLFKGLEQSEIGGFCPENPPISMDTIEEAHAHCHCPIDTIDSMDHGTMDHGTADNEEPAHFAPAIAEALNTFQESSKPGQQRQRLKDRIIREVGDGGMHPSIPGRAADLVVYHGVPLRDLDHILIDMREMRRAGTPWKTSPGAFFCWKAKTLAKRHGIEWGSKADE